MVVGEQGHGDNIQFVRFLLNLHSAGAKILFQTTEGLIPLLGNSNIISWIGRYTDTPPEFDYWTPIMSVPAVIGLTLENLPHDLHYLAPDKQLIKNWADTLGPKKQLRVGFCWSGRRDTWINKHKAIPFMEMLTLIKRNPQHEWINLQLD